ncbi:MAG: IS1 family transposase, partial [Bacteroidales bacterium]|nr:IS1 family transposase [Bacteroidales bacterium]
RHYLARFKRKGLCYSKSESMIVNSLNLLFLKLNNQLSILI